MFSVPYQKTKANLKLPGRTS